jgi:hypothetical protein
VSVTLPIIQIHQQYTQLGIETTPRVQDIEQPEATLDLKQISAKLDITQGQSKLHIDQSDAWDALLLGGIFKTSSRIYSEFKQVALQGIARRMEDGHRIIDSLPNHQNGIAAVAKAHMFDRPYPIEAAGPASSLNVHINFEVIPADIRVEQGGVINNSHVNKPESNFIPSKVNTYVQQRNSIEITAPQMDLTL